MSKLNTGGPAFPMIRDIRHNADWDHEEGMTLRDYFMAHAPEAPQPWFEPVMPPAPKVPKIADIQDEAVREDVRRADDAGIDPETPEGLEFAHQHREAALAYQRWDQERKKQRYIQWPAAWADAMLDQRGSA